MTQKLREAIEKVIADRDAHGNTWDDCLAQSIDQMRHELEANDDSHN